MRLAEGWQDYELLDCSDRNRLERWGQYILIRPDPVVIWKALKTDPNWENPDAVYHRSHEGGGRWEMRRRIPSEWNITWNAAMKLHVTPTGFKHTCVFPEQAANWILYQKMIRESDRPIRVLNLFGYTGAATLACLQAGASVCHVDASKGMTGIAKQNVTMNRLDNAPVRFIVEDCKKFAERELRRQHQYDAIILDPPSYGRGPSGEIWKFEDNIYDFLLLCRSLLSSNPLFLSLNSYTAGLSVGTMRYLTKKVFDGLFSGIMADEIAIPVTSTGQGLPCGVNTLLYNTGKP